MYQNDDSTSIGTSGCVVVARLADADPKLVVYLKDARFIQ